MKPKFLAIAACPTTMLCIAPVISCVPDSPNPTPILPYQNPWEIKSSVNFFKVSESNINNQQIIITPIQLLQLTDVNVSQDGFNVLNKIINFDAKKIEDLYNLEEINNLINTFIKSASQDQIRTNFSKIFNIQFDETNPFTIDEIKITKYSLEQFQLQVLASNQYSSKNLIPFLNNNDLNPQSSLIFSLKFPFSFINMNNYNFPPNITNTTRIIKTSPELFKKPETTFFNVLATNFSQQPLNWTNFHNEFVTRVPEIYFGLGYDQYTEYDPVQQDANFSIKITNLLESLGITFTITKSNSQIIITTSAPNILFLPDGKNNNQLFVNYKIKE